MASKRKKVAKLLPAGKRKKIFENFFVGSIEYLLETSDDKDAESISTEFADGLGNFESMYELCMELLGEYTP